MATCLRLPWIDITSVVTGNPSSTSVIPVNDTSDLVVGAPVRVSQTLFGQIYGVITAVVSNTSITISAPTLSTGQAVDELSTTHPSQVVIMPIFISGTYADGTDTDLLANDMNTYMRWEFQEANLVSMLVTQKTADSGTEPAINARVGGSAVFSANITLSSTPGTWTRNTLATTGSGNYQVSYGDAITLSCDTAGGTGDASDLTAHLIFVLE